jgi:general secretion pathway protein E
LNPASPIPQLAALSPHDASFAVKFIDTVLQSALAYRSSDVHFHPVQAGLEVRWRLDGVLQPLGVFPRGETSDAVARLKVLAGLLTYESEKPQEGRIRSAPSGVEMRVSTFPTLHGERAVVRIFAGQEKYRIDDLGLSPALSNSLRSQLSCRDGAIIISGPAGSGKTTTACACLREIVATSQGQRSLVSLEDPIEVALEGVSQSQVNIQAGLTLDTGLKSLLRQDPEVIFVGEIRDQAIARLVMQAALTGHLVITTFHAGSAAGALARLLDWHIEPYQLHSGLLSLVSQRLVRRLCTCAKSAGSEIQLDGKVIAGAKVAVGCEKCAQTGYHGRMLLAEFLDLKGRDAGTLLAARDRAEMESLAMHQGMMSIRENGVAAVTQGWTSPEEFRRACGVQTP